jgi:hypothetical protein
VERGFFLFSGDISELSDIAAGVYPFFTGGPFQGRNVKGILQDIFLVLGFTSLVYGVWLIHPTAAYIVGGVLLLYAGFPKKPQAPKLAPKGGK